MLGGLVDMVYKLRHLAVLAKENTFQVAMTVLTTQRS